MLNKLMKHEFKATSRLLVPLYLVLLFMSIINRFVFNMNDFDGASGVINQFLIFTYMALIFVILVVTVFYMIIRFYKNLLTDEGYLMFTLPVKTHHLLTSKLLVTILWTIISIAAILLSLFIVFATPESLTTTINGIKEAFVSLNREFGGSFILLIFELIIMCLLSIVANILIIYVSIAIGQLYKKHKIIASFVSYFIIYNGIQFIMIMMVAVISRFAFENPSAITVSPQVIFPVVIVIISIACVGFYAGINYIFRKKLNLD